MGVPMDVDSEQLELKKILVDLEDEHKHLQASVDHLELEIKKREVEIEKLLADRDLELAREYPEYRKKLKACDGDTLGIPRENIKTEPASQFSSEFSEKVNKILEAIIDTSRDISSLIKL